MSHIPAQALTPPAGAIEYLERMLNDPTSTNFDALRRCGVRFSYATQGYDKGGSRYVVLRVYASQKPPVERDGQWPVLFTEEEWG